MASVTYRLKIGKSEWASIYVRFKQGQQFDTEATTSLECPKDRWSQSKQEILATTSLNHKEANKKLNEFKSYIKNEYEATKINEQTIIINNKWLKSKIDFFFNRQNIEEEEKAKIYFENFIETFIEDSKTKRNRLGNPIKPRTIQHYNTTLNKIIAFQNDQNIKLKITDIDLSFHNQFITYLEKKEHLNNNTIGGYLDDIKLFCNNATKRGLQISNDVKTTEFYSPQNKTNDIYLTDEEINNIYNFNFDAEYLDNARDWFIIGLRTGLRISDFLKLTKTNIDNDGFIYKNTFKTDYPVIIPIHEQVEAILNKRNGDFPRRISDQNFNNYIKIVSEKAGLTEVVEGARMDERIVIENNKKKKIHRKVNGKYPKFELVSSHVCRRTFATLLYGKLDSLTIMKITGHSTEKQFLSYIKITPKEYAEKLKALWEKQKASI
jgi:integrase